MKRKKTGRTKLESNAQPNSKLLVSFKASKRLRAALLTKPDNISMEEVASGSASGEQRARIAYHEAGHAVINLGLGIAFTWAVALDTVGWVDASNPCVGWRPGEASRRQCARWWAISMFAGASAEEALGNGVDDEYEDFDSAERWLTKYARPRYATFVGDEAFRRQTIRLRIQSRELVRMHWAKIERTAKALLKLKALRAEEIRAIFEGSAAPIR